MKNLKMNSRSNSSGQIFVILIILLAVIGAGAWWLFSNKQAMATEGRKFGREAIQRIAIQHDLKFFGDHLSPEYRRQFPEGPQPILTLQLNDPEEKGLAASLLEGLTDAASYEAAVTRLQANIDAARQAQERLTEADREIQP